ncbi:MAG: RNA repair transcriptional activator RtcR [bacterium]|nr:RNA repair transcriptional activator RtcR [bacterium]
MPRKKQVVIGLLGTMLDRGVKAERWNRWRPTVALASHADLLIDRFDLLHQREHVKLAKTIVADMAAVSPETRVVLHEVKTQDPWDFPEVYGELHDFARGYDFRPDREDYLVHITTGTHVAQICLFLLTEARYFPARLIQCSPQQGDGGQRRSDPRATKQDNPGSYRIIDLDLSRYDNIASRFKQERQAGVSYLKSGIDTRNRAFNALIEEIERVAIHSKAPILLSGPTGAGKSQLARRVYELKKLRSQVSGAFVEVNCATLRGDGAMSTLFGHVRGAFTGAASARGGLLREADQGILFLDEIGELGLDEQAMLLRALEDKSFLPMGADRETRSDFQLIAGSNRNLPERVRGGHFREDLLARINLWTFALPGLRERPEDIEPNLEYEIEKFARDSGRMVRFSREARALYLEFATSPDALWTANFRDLNAGVTRMATLSPGGRIDVKTVRQEIERISEQWRGAAGSPTTESGQHNRGDRAGAHQSGAASGDEAQIDDAIFAGLLNPAEYDRFDLVQLRRVLEVCREERTLAAAGRRLFSVSRKSMKTKNDSDRLRKYLARFGLTWENLARRD